jgi:2-phospho-L-lactate guanylyltransferase
MHVVVPFAADEPKTRLAGVLTPEERRAFADAMLRDVLAAIRATGREPTVLSTTTLDVDARVAVDARSLTSAVNDLLRGGRTDGEGDRKSGHDDRGEPTAVVMADLALATPDALERLFSADGDVALVPGRGGGTNALVSRHPDFRVDYHGVSYRDHRENALAVGASVAAVDSHRLATDVDVRSDLVEVLLHADGRARDWLEDAGFSLLVAEGRVGVSRE